MRQVFFDRLALGVALVVATGGFLGLAEDIGLRHPGNEVSFEAFGASFDDVLRPRVERGWAGRDRQPGDPWPHDREGLVEGGSDPRLPTVAAATPPAPPVSPLVERRHVVALRAPPAVGHITR